VFAKFVVLILIFGATGVGVLSVRQSRLQSVHEMAESRHRIRQLDEKAGEIRTMIVRSCTPQRVHQLLSEHGNFVPASTTQQGMPLYQQVIESEPQFIETIPIETDQGTELDPHAATHVVTQPSDQSHDDGRLVFKLDDGTRVVLRDN
jgi:hypothetical protein